VLDELIKLHEELAKVPVPGPGPGPPPSGGVYKDYEDARAMYASALLTYLMKHEAVGHTRKVKGVLVLSLLRTELGGSYKRDSSDAPGGQTERTETTDDKKLMDAAKKAGFIHQTELARFDSLADSIDEKKREAVVKLTENVSSRYDAARTQLAFLSVLPHDLKTDSAFMFHSKKTELAEELVERTRALATLNKTAFADGPEGPRDWLSDDFGPFVNAFLLETKALLAECKQELAAEQNKLGKEENDIIEDINEQRRRLRVACIDEIAEIEGLIGLSGSTTATTPTEKELDDKVENLNAYFTGVGTTLVEIGKEIQKEFASATKLLIDANKETKRVGLAIAKLRDSIALMRDLDRELDVMSELISAVSNWTLGGEEHKSLHAKLEALNKSVDALGGVYRESLQMKRQAVYDALREKEAAKTKDEADQKAASQKKDEDRYGALQDIVRWIEATEAAFSKETTKDVEIASAVKEGSALGDTIGKEFATYAWQLGEHSAKDGTVNTIEYDEADSKMMQLERKLQAFRLSLRQLEHVYSHLQTARTEIQNGNKESLAMAGMDNKLNIIAGLIKTFFATETLYGHIANTELDKLLAMLRLRTKDTGPGSGSGSGSGSSDRKPVTDAETSKLVQIPLFIGSANKLVASLEKNTARYASLIRNTPISAKQALLAYQTATTVTSDQLDLNNKLLSDLSTLDQYGAKGAARDIQSIASMKTSFVLLGVSPETDEIRGLKENIDGLTAQIDEITATGGLKEKLDGFTAQIVAIIDNHRPNAAEAARAVFDLTKKTAICVGGELDPGSGWYDFADHPQIPVPFGETKTNDISTFLLNHDLPIVPNVTADDAAFSSAGMDKSARYGEGGMTQRDFIDFGFARALLLNYARKKGSKSLVPVRSKFAEGDTKSACVRDYVNTSHAALSKQETDHNFHPFIDLELVQQKGDTCAKFALFHIWAFSCVIAETRGILSLGPLSLDLDAADNAVNDACNTLKDLYTEYAATVPNDENKQAILMSVQADGLCDPNSENAAIGMLPLAVKLYTAVLGFTLTVHGYSYAVTPLQKIQPQADSAWAHRVDGEQRWTELLAQITDPIAGIVVLHGRHYVSVVPLRGKVNNDTDATTRYVILDSSTHHYKRNPKDNTKHAERTIFEQQSVTCRCIVIKDASGIYGALMEHLRTTEQAIDLNIIMTIVTLDTASMHTELYDGVKKMGYGGARVAALGRFSHLFNKARILDEYAKEAGFDKNAHPSQSIEDAVIQKIVIGGKTDANKGDLDLAYRKGLSFGRRTVGRVSRTRPASNSFSFGISALARNMKPMPTRSTSFGEYVHRAAKHSRAATARHRS
jgi:hypothetical protein